MSAKFYTLYGPDGAYASSVPATHGGHRRQKIYGQLDCPVALRYVARGTYQKNRVFFADEAMAKAAGFRPCKICMKDVQ